MQKKIGGSLALLVLALSLVTVITVSRQQALASTPAYRVAIIGGSISSQRRVISAPPSAFCCYFSCIANFPQGRGYMGECRDLRYSRSGGIRGACSSHRGVYRPLYNHAGISPTPIPPTATPIPPTATALPTPTPIMGPTATPVPPTPTP